MKKTSSQIRTELEALKSKANRIRNQARKQGRDLNVAEKSLLGDIDYEADNLADQLLELPVNGPVTMTNRVAKPGRTDDGFSSFGEQMIAVVNAGTPGGQADARLFNAATGLNETTPAEGGFLVQTDFSNDIMTEAFAEGKLAARCGYQPIGQNANGIKINGVDETSRATGSRFGGIRSYWLAEADEKQASKPKFRQIELELKKNVVLVYATEELLQDASALEAFLRDTCPREIAFNVDDAIVNGSGAGMPLGILNSGCKITVSKEDGQAAASIVPQNIFNMYARTLGDTTNYVWLYNKTIIPQLYGLSLDVGTGGAPMFIPGGTLAKQPESRLLGLPLVEIEQAQALGTEGDLILANLKDGYKLADKGKVKTDVSIHVRFVYDESVFRFVYRVDGQPVRSSALTPYKGGSGATQSHFITLETRS